jgi:hypothetical protein
LVCGALEASSSAKNNSGDPNKVVTNKASLESPSRPFIIWYHTIETGPEILRLAISSGIFSHVMLRGLHEFDRPIEVILNNPNFTKCLKYCRERNVEVIWARWLYPGYKFKGFSFKDAFDSQYYIRRIQQIRKEARLMGIDLVAFDAEPYGHSQLNRLKPDKQINLSEAEFEALNDAVKTATNVAGQVDFVLPSGAMTHRHLYNATHHIGKFAISEYTYYDNPWRLKVKVPYDVFGAYVSVKKENKKHPDLPYFTPREILEKQKLWSHKKGLFIYPGMPKESGAVALEFSKIKTVKPVQDSNDVD